MLPRTITRLPLRSLQNTVFSRIPLAAQAKAAFVTRTMASSSDVKTHEVLDSSELKDGQHKAVDFAGGKVLLSKIKGQVYATSAFCTHYGAPLEKGVLSQDGRVVCPWHGACFNVCTGDIEDSPGLDSLWSYKAEEKDGKIIVSASEKEVKSKVGRVVASARTKALKEKAKKDETVVIIGGGSGGIHAVESLRMNDWAGKIVLLSEEAYAPIDRTKMSKGLADDASKLEWRKVDELRDEFGVDFHPSTTVTKIDTKSRSITTSGDSYTYDHLIIAPGGKPKKIPIDGKDLKNVETMRHVQDTKAITSKINKDADIVVIGTSFIGMEVAAAIQKKEPKSVTLVGVDKVPFAAILGEEIGNAIMQNMKQQGIKFIMEAEITGIKPSSSDSSACGSVSIKGQDDLPADLVIMGTGVGPATGFLKESGFQLEDDGGIAVDEYMRVPGHDNVYAVGDIAHYKQHPEGHQRRVEHWNVAGQQGRFAAHNIAKPSSLVKYDKVPIFWSSVGKGLRYLGTGAGFDETYTDGSIEELKFVTYQAKNGKVTAVASMQRDPVVAKASELMRLDLMPTLEQIRGGKDILQIDLIKA